MPSSSATARTLEYQPGRQEPSRADAAPAAPTGIPVVAVFLSGRPMWVNPELNASDAFVAAFLPGSEGGGVADVLFANADGSVRNDFRGRLSYSWPRRADQTPLNPGDDNYDPLFAYGYGLSYAADGELPTLSEARPAGGVFEEGVLFVRGTLPPGLAASMRSKGTSPSSRSTTGRRRMLAASPGAGVEGSRRACRLAAARPFPPGDRRAQPGV